MRGLDLYDVLRMPELPLKYRSGEEIRKGDRIRFHGNAAEIEFVAWKGCESDLDSNRDLEWYIKEYGGGVMIREPIVFGNAFIPADQLSSCEDLQFVTRG